MLNMMDKKDKWFSDRYRKFTASQNYRLLDAGAGGKGFGKAALTYIEEKAIESMTELCEQPKLEFVDSLLHGNLYEAPAFHHYVEITGNKIMQYHGTDNPIYLPYNKFSGGSPDAVARSEGQIFWGLEVKCPANPKNHFNNLKLVTQWDLKQAKIHDYTQCQMLIMSSGANGWHWMSYDERFINIKMRSKIIEVLPDSNFIANLDIKLKLAEKERKRIIADYKLGKFKYLVNVAVLTTGFNVPDIDCLCFMRPTRSPVLYIQTTGRGVRPVYSEGFDLNTQEGRLDSIANSIKKDCMIVDFGGVIDELGAIDTVDIRKKFSGVKEEIDEKGEREWWYGLGRNKARIYAGKIDENIVQHLAREAIADNALAIRKRYPIAHMVHDEIILVVPEDEAQDALDFMQNIMRTPPKWWPELVTWSEGDIGDAYGEAH